MKKSVMRNTVLTVAALSLLLGGVSNTTKDNSNKVSKTVAQATETSVKKQVPKNEADKIVVAKDLAEENASETILESADVSTVDETITEETPFVEEKEAKVESNQVVANIESYLNIRSEASEDAEVVGKFYNGNVGTIIEEGDEWSLVSSGNAYGYVSNDYLLFGSAAEEYITENCDQIAKVATESLNVRVDDSTDSDIVTITDEGDTLDVIGEEDGWFKVALEDDMVGYVSSDYVYIDYAYETAITIEEEQQAIEAAEAEAAAWAQDNVQESVEETYVVASGNETTEEPRIPSNSATTVAPVETTSTTSGAGQEVADFAVQFVGNPYVYGGSSLTDGADCSGFVMAVYANFGYNLPHSSSSQAQCGTPVSISDLQPGDLLFYHGFGHVAIYIGNDQVVHASNPQTGIKISVYNYSNIDKAVRIIN